MLVKGKGCEIEKVSVLGQSAALEADQGYGLQFELRVLPKYQPKRGGDLG